MSRRFNRYDHRCDYCGRFMPWAWVSSWNCFAGFSKAWCDRDACWQTADTEAGA
ncbi:hypothetical protein M2302_000305 [Micromonospora sp. A200]|uniref:hypothetical protein n=1 Tax=Micromonospora sp. A200 TaxID=2940568 RepID=UPI00247342D8|nr:hypothetical protein [Micromonospora sp. A200]MDH6460154.1 hypothetical protein [Micromonospora sp. A200]